jgi:hypothetical protein
MELGDEATSGEDADEDGLEGDGRRESGEDLGGGNRALRMATDGAAQG